MNVEHADLDVLTRASMLRWRPPPKRTLSEWADEHFRLSAESAAEPGRWHTLPYQRAIMDAITDPTVSQISLMKSARVGYTLLVSAAVGYFIHQSPCSILLVQPTVDDAKGFSKDTIAPMLRDVPVLAEIVFDDEDGGPKGPKDSGNTILAKRFPGGVLQLIGANSGSGFRRVSRKVVIFDEVDAYPPSAGNDGDPIKLGIKRAEYFWDRKIIAGSTPLVAGSSRIADLYEQGDKRKFFVPCPQCGHMAPLVWSDQEAGHWIEFEPEHPEDAHAVCQLNGCAVEHSQKRDMVAGGEWRAEKPFAGHASFHISALYSYSPNASWGQIASEFLDAKRNPETLRVFVNTVLGETWQERGEAPEWKRLHERGEPYPVGTVPDGAKFMTAGIDVQKDRWVYEVVAWGEGKESWSVDAGVIPGITSNETEWAKLDVFLNQTYTTAAGHPMAVRMLAIDSGYNTQSVYNWARRYVGRVIAIKGSATAKTLIGSPTPVDVTFGGRRIARGCKVWPVGVDIAKSELYGWLRMPDPGPGWCHFPQHEEEYFKQLTAEQLVTHTNAHGFTTYEWQKLPGRENHWLDARVYARAAAAVLGIDRMSARPATTATPAAPAPAPRQQNNESGFLNKAGRAKTGWLR